MIATSAIRIGTNASSEANTKASTISAPKPPRSVSTNTPAATAAGLALQRVDAGHEDCAPATVSAERRGRALRGRVLAEGLSVGWGIGDHERRPAVGGDERPNGSLRSSG